MPPSAPTIDYYKVLEVNPTATFDEITKCYRRLALKRHPDRGGSTEAFQLLQRAYEILADETKRLEYDSFHRGTNTQGRQSRSQGAPQQNRPSKPSAPPATQPSAQSEAANERKIIAALRMAREKRNVRWRARQFELKGEIFGLECVISGLQQEIKNLVVIAAAEAMEDKAEEEKKKAWLGGILSPRNKQRGEGEEAKRREDVARHGRRVEKDMKERRLASSEAKLKEREAEMSVAERNFDKANSVEDAQIEVLVKRKEDREWQQKKEAEKRREVWKKEAKSTRQNTT